MITPPAGRMVGRTAALVETIESSVFRLVAGGTTLTGGNALTSTLGASVLRRVDAARGARWTIVDGEDAAGAAFAMLASLAG